LRNLKTLKIDRISGTEIKINNFLSLLKNDSVEELTVYGILNLDELTIKQLAINLPRLKELEITSESSINIVNAIIQNFTNLEVLKFETVHLDGYNFCDGLKHENLKSLYLNWRRVDQFIELPKFIKCCKKLENLSISSPMSGLSLLETLKASNLNYLKLDSSSHCTFVTIDLKFLADFKEHCKNLKKFTCTPCVSIKNVTTEMIKEEFKDLFRNVTVQNKSSYEIFGFSLQMKQF
jgi:hypothetical protein